MSEALIGSLNQRITELERNNGNLLGARKKATAEARELRELVAKLNDDLKALAAERDSWRAKADAAPSEQSARIAELESQLASRDHRDAFRAEAAKVGVNPGLADDLYMLSGLKPGTESGRPEAIAEFLEAAKTSRPWAFGSPSPSGQHGMPAPSGQNGNAQGSGLMGTTIPPGAGRSASAATVNGVRYTADEVRKPGWQQARPELVDALQRGVAVFVE